jgi:hypothetical protein
MACGTTAVHLLFLCYIDFDVMLYNALLLLLYCRRIILVIIILYIFIGVFGLLVDLLTTWNTHFVIRLYVAEAVLHSSSFVCVVNCFEGEPFCNVIDG